MGMQCKDNLRLILILIQLGVFVTIFIFQIILGTAYNGVNEWFHTIWCLIFAVTMLVGYWVKFLQKWFPWILVTWKLSLAIATAAVFGFRTYFIDVRTLLAWSLMGVSIVFLIVSLVMKHRSKDPHHEHHQYEEPQYVEPDKKSSSFEFQAGVEGTYPNEDN